MGKKSSEGGENKKSSSKSSKSSSESGKFKSGKKSKGEKSSSESRENKKSSSKSSKSSSGSKKPKSGRGELTLAQWKELEVGLGELPPQLRLAELYDLLRKASGEVRALVMDAIVEAEDELKDARGDTETPSAPGDLMEIVTSAPEGASELEAAVAGSAAGEPSSERENMAEIYSPSEAPNNYATYSKYERDEPEQEILGVEESDRKPLERDVYDVDTDLEE